MIYILFLLFPLLGIGQNYAVKEYYLVDSLDLDELNDKDKQIVEEYLKKFHEASHDTMKIIQLAGITNQLNHEVWKEYQFIQYEMFKKLLKHHSISDNLKEYYSRTINNIAIIYNDKGNKVQAMEYYSKGLKIREEIGDKKGIANSYNSIGTEHKEQGNIKLALKYYKHSLKIREELGIKKSIANSYNNIGAAYKELGDTSKAMDYFYKCLNLSKEINLKEGVFHSSNNIASVYKDLNQIEKAHQLFMESLKVAEEMGSKHNQATAYINIASIYLFKHDYNEALKIGLQAYEISNEIQHVQSIQRASKLLNDVYEEKGNYKEALDYYKIHISLRDSLNNLETQKATSQQQAKYEYEKQKAVDDAEHDKAIAIEQEAKEKQTFLTYSTAGGLGLVGIFLLIVFNRLTVTRKQKNIIEAQKQEVENQKAVVEFAHTELEEKNKEITDSIMYAKRIQNAILPPNKVVKEYLKDSFIYYKPKDIVAGDFYWLEQKDNKILFAAADCTGHGVPGAMVSVVCNNGLNRSLREYGLTDPGQLLDKTREIVIQEFEKSEEEVKDGMDIALCCLEGNKLQYAGAHNPLWIIRKGEQEIEEIKANKQPIGQFDSPEPYRTHTIELQKGDTIYIFSDGYADQFGGEQGKKMKSANFKKLLLTIQHEDMKKQKQLIDDAFEQWRGDLEQLDDVCVIGVRI